MIKQKERIENISEYSDFKVLHELKKKRSPLTIRFVEDKKDNWFVYVLEYKTKSGIITTNSMIIKCDVNDWLSHRIHLGFLET